MVYRSPPIHCQFHIFNHLTGSTADTGHGQGTDEERQRTTDQQTDNHHRVDQVDHFQLNGGCVSGEQRQGGHCRGSNRKALGDGRKVTAAARRHDHPVGGSAAELFDDQLEADIREMLHEAIECEAEFAEVLAVREEVLAVGDEPAIDADAAPIELNSEEVLITTDGFTVQPLEFPGGDIGSLSVHGTTNDLAVAGARPLYLTLNAFIEEGLEIATLERIVASLAEAARKAGVRALETAA